MLKLIRNVASGLGIFFVVLSLPILVPLLYFFGIIETEKERGERVYRDYTKWKTEKDKEMPRC